MEGSFQQSRTPAFPAGTLLQSKTLGPGGGDQGLAGEDNWANHQPGAKRAPCSRPLSNRAYYEKRRSWYQEILRLISMTEKSSGTHLPCLRSSFLNPEGLRNSILLNQILFRISGANIGTIYQAGPPRFLDFVLRSSFSQEILRIKSSHWSWMAPIPKQPSTPIVRGWRI